MSQSKKFFFNKGGTAIALPVLSNRQANQFWTRADSKDG